MHPKVQAPGDDPAVTFSSPNVGGHLTSPFRRGSLNIHLTIPKKVTSRIARYSLPMHHLTIPKRARHGFFSTYLEVDLWKVEVKNPRMFERKHR